MLLSCDGRGFWIKVKAGFLPSRAECDCALANYLGCALLCFYNLMKNFYQPRKTSKSLLVGDELLILLLS